MASHGLKQCPLNSHAFLPNTLIVAHFIFAGSRDGAMRRFRCIFFYQNGNAVHSNGMHSIIYNSIEMQYFAYFFVSFSFSPPISKELNLINWSFFCIRIKYVSSFGGYCPIRIQKKMVCNSWFLCTQQFVFVAYFVLIQSHCLITSLTACARAR